MCIIAVSKRGVKQPTLEQLRTMYENNPHGAGYMYARDGKVHIHKGFMTWDDFERQIKAEAFTAKDPVVYHFRISTQAGVCPQMTHPFPLTSNLNECEALDLTCPIGLAHNGIIRMTSFNKEVRYSDTAYFIAWYMTRLVRNRADIADAAVNEMIETLTNSKWAIMDGKSGEIETVGKFVKSKGLLFSNDSYLPTYGKAIGKASKYSDPKYWDDVWSDWGCTYTYPSSESVVKDDSLPWETKKKN